MVLLKGESNDEDDDLLSDDDDKNTNNFQILDKFLLGKLVS